MRFCVSHEYPTSRDAVSSRGSNHFYIFLGPVSEPALHSPPWLAAFCSPRFSKRIWSYHIFYKSPVRFMSLDFLMGHFRILIQSEAASTSHRPEPISLRIEECIDFKSRNEVISSRGADQFEAEECVDFESGSATSSSRGMCRCKSARADPETRGSVRTSCSASASEGVSSPHRLELGPPIGKNK
jgi:hypothetical protein